MDFPVSSHQPASPRSGGDEANGNPHTDPPPQVAIDRFIVIRAIGEGGMGEVFLARHPVTGMEVAIKRLKPSLVGDIPASRRFLSEARHMYHLNHPRIQRIMEVWDPPAGPYYVMPYQPAGALSGKLRPGQPMDYVQTLRIATDIAEALAFAHQKGILHRDLKPANVLLGEDGHAFLTDFGLVRPYTSNDSIPEDLPAICEGTAPYMSPAVARGDAEDTRGDIYSFGALLYELLTGSVPYPFDGNEAKATMGQTLKRIIAAAPPKIVHRNPMAPANLVAVAEGCMARELHDRYAKMADVVEDLHLIAAGKPPLGPRRTPKPSRLRMTLVLVLVLGIGVGAWGIQRHFAYPKTIDLTSRAWVDGSVGITRTSAGELRLKSGPMHDRVCLVLPYTPRREYDFCVEFTRVSGDDGLDQCLSFRDHQFCWTLAGAGNTTSSLWWIGDGGFGNNASTSTNPGLVRNGTRHRSRVEVRNEGVSTFLDDVKISEYHTDYSDLHFPKPQEIANVWNKNLGLSILNGEFLIHQVQVTER